jgi:phospholipid/cholesterol/gamma-HCH transport system permease protein
MTDTHDSAICPTSCAVRDLLEFVGETTLLAWSALAYLLRGRFSFREAVRQMAVLGADSLPIVLLTTSSTGAVFSLYTVGIFVTYGATNFIGGTLTIAFLLELGPLLAGISFASRGAAAIASELGSMVVTEQVDALRALAVAPARYLVAPRVLACVLMLPVATVFADLSGIVGGLLMAMAHGVPQTTFIESARQIALPSDLLKGIVKTFWFGFTIAIVACRQGLRTRGGASGVGRATTSSVVACVVLIFLSDFVLAQMLGAGSGGRR